MPENETMLGWVYKDRRPATDREYFENMTRVIFEAGLNWKLIEKKWPSLQKAFKNFSISKVAQFGDVDVTRLMADKDIIRNRKKILATIFNARQFQAIKKNFESFHDYLKSLDRTNNYALIVAELRKKFKHLGPSSTRIFLYTVGEEVKHES